MATFPHTLEDKIMKKLMLVLLLVFALPLYGGSIAQAQAIPKSIVVVFTGTDILGEIRDIDGTDMDCFDVDITDPVSGRILGTGTDCLALTTTPIGDDGGFTIENTQFFHLPQGTIVTSITTTIQPVGAVGSPGLTHVTGAVEADGVLRGDRRFRNAKGRVRLNGGVDLSQLGSNIITFDCLFRIDFD